MAQTGVLVKKDSKVVQKAVFSGDISAGIAAFKTYIEGLNSSTTFTYEEYDSEAASYANATLDQTEYATLNWE